MAYLKYNAIFEYLGQFTNFQKCVDNFKIVHIKHASFWLDVQNLFQLELTRELLKSWGTVRISSPDS